MKTLVFNGWAAGPETWEFTTFERDYVFNYLEQMAGAHQAVLEEADSLILIGFSMGGIAVMKALLKYPEKIKGVVLISTTPRMMEDKATGWKGLSPHRLEALRWGTEMVYRDDPSPLYDKTNMDKGLRCLEECDLRAALKELKRADYPVYVFHSEKDGVVRPHNAEFFRSVFPQAKVTYVAGNEHVLPVKIPELIDEAVLHLN